MQRVTDEWKKRKMLKNVSDFCSKKGLKTCFHTPGDDFTVLKVCTVCGLIPVGFLVAYDSHSLQTCLLG